MGHINLHMKLAGKRSAFNAHAAFDEGGAGNETMATGLRLRAKVTRKNHQQT